MYNLMQTIYVRPEAEKKAEMIKVVTLTGEQENLVE